MEEEGERHEGLELLAGNECPPPPHRSLLQSASSSSLLRDVKLLSLLEMKQHVVKWLSHHLEPYMLVHLMHFL